MAKVVIVSFTGDSGLTDYAVSLAKSMAIRDDVSLFTAESLPVQFNAMGFKVLRVFRRSRHFPIDIFKFVFKIIAYKPEWVIVQGPLKFAWFDAFVFKFIRLFGIRCAITVHDVMPHYPKPWSKREYSFYYRSFEKVIAHSEAASQALLAMGISRKILVVPHGIYDIFNCSHLTQLQALDFFPSIEKNSIKVLFFGNLESRKGLWEFIATASRLADKKFTFIIAGAPHLENSGPGADDRLEQAKGLPNMLIHDKRIEFDAVERYFAAADIIALPYLEGTTSGVLKLALAFGKPVVASRVGDFPEQVPAGAGILIDPNNLGEELPSALIAMGQNLAEFSYSMKHIASNAQWPDIACNIAHYLQAD
jgi:glycosyltransferase involved in cell wall biosynthesis